MCMEMREVKEETVVVVSGRSISRELVLYWSTDIDALGYYIYTPRV